MSFDDDLRSLKDRPNAEAEALGELARDAIAQQREEEALPLLAEASRTAPTARIWQWRGLLERALDEHAEALTSFAQAAALSTADASIAHGHARVALEAGVPAVDLFARALKLAPADPQVYLGLNAARIAAGRGEEAEAELDQVLLRSPLWLDGHHQLAQLRSLLGRREHAFDSLERAILVSPGQSPLWQALFELHLQSEDYHLLDEWLERARLAGMPAAAIRVYEFIAASELGRADQAQRIADDPEAMAIPPVWLVRHQLRSGQLQQACALIDSELAGPRAPDMWPYATTAWRMAEDTRFDWLTGSASLISVIDLSKDLNAIPGLADLLRSLHRTQGRYLNQSVRGGTQTDGPLFSRVEPEVRSLRAAIVRAVEEHSAGLVSLPEGHPQKNLRPGCRVRFSGSWSVRLVDGGCHANHVHPRGWISSALYIDLPDTLDEGPPYGGWLCLGEPPPELGLDLPPTRTIQPRTGQLVLFPSWMWHGTRPFREGERLTVAFDVARPS